MRCSLTTCNRQAILTVRFAGVTTEYSYCDRHDARQETLLAKESSKRRRERERKRLPPPGWDPMLIDEILVVDGTT